VSEVGSRTRGTTYAEKEADVKKILSLVLALGVVALFSGVTLAGADCSYHKTQAAVDKTDATKDVATVPAPEKVDTNQVQTAQANPPAPKPAPEVKK
jgi:hypothetical protein